MPGVHVFAGLGFTVPAYRVLNVLRHWVEFHYYDFERHPKLLLKLRSFVGSVKSKSMQKWVISINRSLQKKDAQPSAFKHVFSSKAEPGEWHIAKKNEEYHLLTVCCCCCYAVLAIVARG